MTTQSPDQSLSQSPTGTEAEVCADIAARQAKGIAKYGVSVADNPLNLREWLQHAYEEGLDQAVYLKRAISTLAQSPAPSKAGTPLTDAEYASWPVLDTQTGGEAVRIQFARKLERDYGAEILALEEENRKLRGQIVSQPPAPSEEMEERIKRIADDVAQRNTSTVEAHYLVEDSAIEAMESLAAELGKEREVDTNTLAEIIRAEGKQLREKAGQEIETLKRELAEAQGERATLAQRFANLERDEAAQRAELLALSASYQRQKEALNEARKAVSEWDGGGAGSACRSLIQVKQALSKALAETPDVSMWENLKADYNELIMAVAQKFSGETRHQTALRYINEAEALSISGPHCVSPTLQPDHQK